MKTMVMIVLLLSIPSATLAAEGSWGIQTLLIDSVEAVRVLFVGDDELRIANVQATLDPSSTPIGAAAPCTTLTLIYNPDDVDLGSSAATIKALDEYNSVYALMLSGVLIDKRVTVSVIEGSAAGACTVLGSSILAD